VPTFTFDVLLLLTFLVPSFIQASGVDAPFNEDISTPHEKALGETSWGEVILDGGGE
jgi:hypothetical protein